MFYSVYTGLCLRSWSCLFFPAIPGLLPPPPVCISSVLSRGKYSPLKVKGLQKKKKNPKNIVLTCFRLQVYSKVIFAKKKVCCKSVLVWSVLPWIIICLCKPYSVDCAKFRNFLPPRPTSGLKVIHRCSVDNACSSGSGHAHPKFLTNHTDIRWGKT